MSYTNEVEWTGLGDVLRCAQGKGLETTVDVDRLELTLIIDETQWTIKPDSGGWFIRQGNEGIFLNIAPCYASPQAVVEAALDIPRLRNRNALDQPPHPGSVEGGSTPASALRRSSESITMGLAITK